MYFLYFHEKIYFFSEKKRFTYPFYVETDQNFQNLIVKKAGISEVYITNSYWRCFYIVIPVIAEKREIVEIIICKCSFCLQTLFIFRENWIK